MPGITQFLIGTFLGALDCVLPGDEGFRGFYGEQKRSLLKAVVTLSIRAILLGRLGPILAGE